MKAVIQRVKKASVSADGKKIGKIKKGLVVFLGIKEDDNQKDAQNLALKIAHLRVMADKGGKMNLSVKDILQQRSGQTAEILVISQFSLYADTSYGRRPSFITAARPEIAKPLYEEFIQKLKNEGIKVTTGQFGAYMQVDVVNDGPVTIMLES